MISTLHFLLLPLATFGLAFWAAWLSLATEADADVPRLVADQHFAEGQRLSPARSLYVGHLAALFLAGAAAGIAESWWAWAPAGALTRFGLAALLVWLVGSILPKVLAVVAPELPAQLRPAAIRSLRLLAPLLAAGVIFQNHNGSRVAIGPRTVRLPRLRSSIPLKSTRWIGVNRSWKRRRLMANNDGLLTDTNAYRGGKLIWLNLRSFRFLADALK